MMRKTVLMTVAGIAIMLSDVQVHAEKPDTNNMHFSSQPGVVCGSEATVRRWFFEYDRGLPFTVFKDDDSFGPNPKTVDGTSCVPNLLGIIDQNGVSLIARHGAFCSFRMHHGPLSGMTFWILCAYLEF